MPLLTAFIAFPQEAQLIGRLVAGYTEIELDLMHCVRAVRDDLDTVLKALYRSRGEGPRIDVADALGRHAYHALNLGTQFEMGIGSVRHCMKIRNQHAHSMFWDDRSGELAFANIEELARVHNVVTDLKGLNTRHLDVALLGEQLAYFEYTSSWLAWVLNEGNRTAGRIHHPGVARPAALPEPRLSK